MKPIGEEDNSNRKRIRKK